MSSGILGYGDDQRLKGFTSNTSNQWETILMGSSNRSTKVLSKLPVCLRCVSISVCVSPGCPTLLNKGSWSHLNQVEIPLPKSNNCNQSQSVNLHNSKDLFLCKKEINFAIYIFLIHRRRKEVSSLQGSLSFVAPQDNPIA